MKTIRYFARLGFDGSDASLAESLFEYRLIWRQIKRLHAKHRQDPKNYPVGEWEFVAPSLHVKGLYSYFWFKDGLDFKHEFNWVSENQWAGFLDWLGMTWKEWSELSFPQRIEDMIGYFGQIEILGDDYGRGFHINA